jgi:cephalosporin hydroxylase
MNAWRQLRAQIPTPIKRALRGGQRVSEEAIYDWFLERWVTRIFAARLARKTTNFADCRWLGQRCWQNVLDLWTIQETLSEVRPSLLSESGTNRGGSALYYAHLFDLMGQGRVITVDITKMHELTHPRIEFLLGSSVSEPILGAVRSRVADTSGPIMVILDSDHRDTHVLAELEAYGPFVTPGSYVLVQDGIIDMLPSFAGDRPGPLPAIQRFLPRHPEFEVDHARCDRFLVTQHPMGWLRRRTQYAA